MVTAGEAALLLLPGAMRSPRRFLQHGDADRHWYDRDTDDEGTIGGLVPDAPAWLTHAETLLDARPGILSSQRTVHADRRGS